VNRSVAGTSIASIKARIAGYTLAQDVLMKLTYFKPGCSWWLKALGRGSAVRSVSCEPWANRDNLKTLTPTFEVAP
jgi:hypothetical protein